MSQQISLHEYTAQVTKQIESGSADRAIAHCRHILTHYPRYLPVYRLLAQACLENGDLAHATHFFQCVLSADPEDASAWMNLAMLSDDLGELEQATWLMERAFELEPGSTRIRGLLGQLYARRDGVERTRIKLTAGALARLYAAGGFYRHSVEELQKLLAESPGLMPLHAAQLELALVKALWYIEGMAPLADKTCRGLIEKLPSCLQANLIMGQIRWSAGNEKEAQPYLEVARALDPEARVAHAMFGERSPLPFTQVEIPYLEYQAPVSVPELAAPLEPEDTSWLDRVGQGAEPDVALASVVEEEAEPPTWLETWPESESRVLSDLQPAPEEEAQVSDWLAEQENSAEPGIVEAEPVPASDLEESPRETPDWLLRATTGPLSEQDLPDWLRDLGSGAGDEEVALAEEAPTQPAVEEDVPDWLRELGTDVEGEGTTLLPAVGEETPDWLHELGQDVEGEQAALAEEIPAQPAVEEETPGWLDSRGVDMEESTLAPMTEGELPNWLHALDSEEVDDEAVILAGESQAVPMAEEELPAWLRELGLEEHEEQTADEQAVLPSFAEEAPAEPIAEEEIPEWLRGLRPQGQQEQAALTGEDEAGLADASVGFVSEVGLPGWLRELQSEETVPEPELTIEEEELAVSPEIPAEPTSEEEIPGWLRELRSVMEPAPGEVEYLAEEELDTETTQLGITEEDPLALPADQETVGIPDWLRELEIEVSGPAVEEVPPTQIDLAAAPVAGPATTVVPEAAVEMPPPVEGMPGWLQELEAEIGGQVAEEVLPAQPESAMPPVAEVPAVAPEEAAELPPPAEGMPGWLRELEAEIGGQATQEVLPTQPEVIEPAPAEEVPASVEEFPEWLAEKQVELDQEIPEWLSELGAGAAEEELGLAAEVPAEMPAEQPSPEGESEERPEWLDRLGEAEVSEVTVDEMPEWLQRLRTSDAEVIAAEELAAPATPPETEEMAWLQELEEMEAPSLPSTPPVEPVTTQAAATQVEEEEQPAPSEPGSAVTSEKPVARPEPVAPSTAVHSYQARLLPIEEDSRSRLALARAYLQQGNLDVSAQEFEQLAKMPSLAPTLIEDLEEAVQAHPHHHALHRVLGDAYMRAGQLKKALNAYKEALTKL